MSGNKRRRRTRRPASGRSIRRPLVIVGLALCAIAAGVVMARRAASVPAVEQGRQAAPASLLPSSPSKEYIYAGSKLVATEEPQSGRSGTMTASLNPIPVCGETAATAGLSWSGTGTTEVEVRIGSPGGTLFSHTASSGAKVTGKWVSNGMVFYLQDVSGGLPLTSANTLGTLTMSLTSGHCGTRTGSISASPNPIQVCDGTGLGTTTLNWTTTNAAITEIHIGSPSGQLFSQQGPSGTATTGKWVSNGMVFYLQDVSGGLPLTSANTLATFVVDVNSAGCPP